MEGNRSRCKILAHMAFIELEMAVSTGLGSTLLNPVGKSLMIASAAVN